MQFKSIKKIEVKESKLSYSMKYAKIRRKKV